MDRTAVRDGSPKGNVNPLSIAIGAVKAGLNGVGEPSRLRGASPRGLIADVRRRRQTVSGVRSHCSRTVRRNSSSVMEPKPRYGLRKLALWRSSPRAMKLPRPVMS